PALGVHAPALPTRRSSDLTLKIDRSFVDGLGADLQDTAIVRSVVDLAQALDVTVTGEGIETDAQEAELRALGCDGGQGFLFARRSEEHTSVLQSPEHLVCC